MVIKDKPLSSIKADIVHAFLSVSLSHPSGDAHPTQTLAPACLAGTRGSLHGPLAWGGRPALVLSSPGCGSTTETGSKAQAAHRGGDLCRVPSQEAYLRFPCALPHPHRLPPPGAPASC